VDATRRIQAEVAQREALSRQKELNDLKARFISMASHEFRTPLSSITGSVDLLMHYADRIGPEERQEALQKIHSAVGRMTRMLENVLQVGQAEAGPLPFDPVPVAVTTLSQAVVDEVRGALAQRGVGLGVELHLHLPPPSTQCMLDEGLWRHIVGNLVSNALKYSHTGGRVDVVIHPQAQQLELTVQDQGIGIAPHDMPRLFEAFHRGSNVGQISGTGLGLSIVQQAVAAHRGELNVDSTLGQGTRFTIRLPLGLPATPP
jgi:signal transduction histidine kinase